jgi:hypothetical protein
MNTKRSTLLGTPLAAAAIAIVFANTSHGFGGPPGGPFSNGSYFPNDGTFSAVVRSRAQNLTGILQFSTTQTSGAVPSSVSETTTGIGNSAQTSTIQRSGLGGVGSTGVATIYYNGDTYDGNSQGSFNSRASTLTVTFQAGAQGQGENEYSIEKQVVNTENATISISGNSTLADITTLPFKTVTYFDSLYLNGFADCITSNSFPNQKFEGTGEAQFQHLIFTGDTPFLDAVDIPVYVTGIRLSNQATSFNVLPVRPPSVNEVSVLIPIQ